MFDVETPSFFDLTHLSAFSWKFHMVNETNIPEVRGKIQYTANKPKQTYRKQTWKEHGAVGYVLKKRQIKEIPILGWEIPIAQTKSYESKTTFPFRMSGSLKSPKFWNLDVWLKCCEVFVFAVPNMSRNTDLRHPDVVSMDHPPSCQTKLHSGFPERLSLLEKEDIPTRAAPYGYKSAETFSRAAGARTWKTIRTQPLRKYWKLSLYHIT